MCLFVFAIVCLAIYLKCKHKVNNVSSIPNNNINQDNLNQILDRNNANVLNSFRELMSNYLNRLQLDQLLYSSPRQPQVVNPNNIELNTQPNIPVSLPLPIKTINRSQRHGGARRTLSLPRENLSHPVIPLTTFQPIIPPNLPTNTPNVPLSTSNSIHLYERVHSVIGSSSSARTIRP